mgnify:CR=1 FL=1
MIIYEGPSALDGAPIVAIATGLERKSRNEMRYAKGYGEGNAVTLHFWRFTIEDNPTAFEDEIAKQFPDGNIIRRFRCNEGVNPFWRISVRYDKDPRPFERAPIGEFSETEAGAL